MKLEIDTNAVFVGGAFFVVCRAATVVLSRRSNSSSSDTDKVAEADGLLVQVVLQLRTAAAAAVSWRRRFCEPKADVGLLFQLGLQLRAVAAAMSSWTIHSCKPKADHSILHQDAIISDFLMRKGCMAFVQEPSPEPELEPEEETEADDFYEFWQPTQKAGPFTMLRLSSRPRMLVIGTVLLMARFYPYTGNVRGMDLTYGPHIASIHYKPLATIELKEQVLGSGRSTRSAYYGTLQLGTPGIPYTFVFDTGSGHLIVPSGYCHSKVCKQHKRYRRSASKTGKDIDGDGALVGAGGMRDQLNVQFGTGEVTSVFVEDVVCLDKKVMKELEDITSHSEDSIPLELPAGCFKMRFLAATQMSQQPFERFQFDGILGLGLSGLSQSEEFNFMHVLAGAVKDWGSQSPYTFGVFLAASTEEKSELALGGWESDHLDGDLFWNRVDKPELGHWIIKVKSLRIGDQVLPFCQEGCKAVVDSGTSLMSVPTVAFPEIYDGLRHDAALDGECKGSGPQLHIELEHFTVTMNPEDYAQSQTYRNRDEQVFGRAPFISKHEGSNATRNDMYCQPMLMSMDLEEPIGPKLFILGEPVLKKYYTVYDAQTKRVGFGLAKHKPEPLATDDLDDLDEEWWSEFEDDEEEH